MKKNGTSVSLYDKYPELGGIMLSRNGVVDGTKSYFGNKILLLSLPGLAKIVPFPSRASEVLKIEEEEDEAPDLAKLAKLFINKFLLCFFVFLMFVY